MPFGAITGYVDLAQILLYVFWLFFAGLIFYLVREGHREGYPMESDSLDKAVVKGWPIPSPKTYKLAGGHEVTIPDPKKLEPPVVARSTGASPGSPIEPTGDPMLDGVGAAAWANRADVPDMTLEGEPKIIPLRAAAGFAVAKQDADPRGLPVIAGDGKVAGTVHELWLDTSEMLFRYIEVDTGSRKVLAPMPFVRVRRNAVEINSIYAHHFANVPAIRNADQVTMAEEERIQAYYGGGTFYASPERSQELL